jgi:hypothetical protein
MISFTLGLGFVLGHHFFLHSVHDTGMGPDETAEFTQFWIKGASNAFSQAVSICLGTSAAYSLTQAVSMPPS